MILGAVQGLTEFLPISSSAHLILLPWMFGRQGTLIDSLSFDVAVHAGTLLAILGYFWRDWLSLSRKFLLGFTDGTWRTGEGRLVWFIAMATVPAGFIGMRFEHVVEESFRNPLLIVASLTLVSGIMWGTDRYSKQTAGLERMTLLHALFVGFAQAVALVPGVSRSGITISAGLVAGYRREDAARFSFLLATPVIAGAAVVKLVKLRLAEGEALPFLLGAASAAVVGYLCIAFLLRYLARHSLNLFVWYRLCLAAVVLAVWFAKR